jgi:hypothetical protein
MTLCVHSKSTKHNKGRPLTASTGPSDIASISTLYCKLRVSSTVEVTLLSELLYLAAEFDTIPTTKLDEQLSGSTIKNSEWAGLLLSLTLASMRKMASAISYAQITGSSALTVRMFRACAQLGATELPKSYYLFPLQNLTF